jgi:hypothetical protein
VRCTRHLNANVNTSCRRFSPSRSICMPCCGDVSGWRKEGNESGTMMLFIETVGHVIAFRNKDT